MLCATPEKWDHGLQWSNFLKHHPGNVTSVSKVRQPAKSILCAQLLQEELTQDARNGWAGLIKQIVCLVILSPQGPHSLLAACEFPLQLTRWHSPSCGFSMAACPEVAVTAMGNTLVPAPCLCQPQCKVIRTSSLCALILPHQGALDPCLMSGIVWKMGEIDLRLTAVAQTAIKNTQL